MWRPVACPRFPRVPLPQPRVVPLVVGFVPRPRPAMAFFLAIGAGLAADVLVSVVRLKLAQMLVLDDGLFLAAGVFLFGSGTVFQARGKAQDLAEL